jgi:hypothetical protein
VSADDLRHPVGQASKVAGQLVLGGIAVERAKLLAEVEPDRRAQSGGILMGKGGRNVGFLGHAPLSGAQFRHLNMGRGLNMPDF